MRRTAIVIGAGLAGVAAATVLAERGIDVQLVEREAFLGGRAGAWTDELSDGTPFEMERGFHAFFRHYKNLRALMRRVDPSLSCLKPLDDYPLLGPLGARESFSGLPKTPGLNVLALIRRSRSIRFRDLLGVDVERAREMLSFDPEATYARLDQTSATEFLDGLRFPRAARQMLFDVFAHSFFNPEAQYSAAELLAMFHFYFTRNPEGLVFDVMTEPFSVGLWRPLERHLRSLGVDIKKRATATRVDRDDDGRFSLAVARDGSAERTCADAVVLAVEVPALKALVSASPGLQPLSDPIHHLDVTLPFAVWRLWLDRPCAQDRAPFAGTTGVGILDNISLYERIEGQSARWSARTGGSVIELHAYAVPESLSEDDARAELLQNLHAFYPEVSRARIVDERLLMRRDCPSFAPGSYATRPTVKTPIDGVVLAGDYVKLPFASALMERSVASGFSAANQLLRSWGLAEETVLASPKRGILAPRVGLNAM